MRNSGTTVLLSVVGAFLAAFLIYPVLYIFRESFWVNGGFSLQYFRLILDNGVMRDSIFYSILLGLAATAATTLVAVPLALVSVRFTFRGKGLLSALLLVPMIMPPFVGAIGMQRLLAKGGSVNLLLKAIGLPTVDFFGGGGFWAVALMEALHLYPIMYLNVAAAMANVDPALEEAARNMGDHGFRLFRKITFPLMLPGYFAGAALVFIWAFTDLGTPLIFNLRRVVSVQIFEKVQDMNTNPIGYALVVVVTLLSAAAFLAGRIAVGHGHQMQAKASTARQEKPLTGWRTALIWLLLLLLIFIAILPHISVFLTAITGRWSDTILPTEVTAKYFARAFQEDTARTGIRNSLMLAFGSTLIDIVLGVGIAYVLVRKRFPGSGLLDALSMMPLALPGIVLAFGYMGCFRGTILDPRGNPFPLLMIAYAVRRLPYMVRAAYAGFQQTSVTLEEAAMNVGASPARALFKITLPLIMANLIAGAILSFSFAMLEVSDSLILATQEKHYPLTKAIYSLHTLITEGDYIASAMGVFAMLLLVSTLIGAGLLLGKRMGQLFRV